jgi:hypothetical protein
LSIALQRGDTYTSGSDLGALMYRIPSQATSRIYTASFDWSITLPTNWQLRLQFFDAAYGFISSTTVATGNGALQTGTSSPTTTNASVALFFVFNNTGANYTAAGETGTQYAKITNLRMKGTNSAALYASEIASLMAVNVAAANPSQVETLDTEISMKLTRILNLAKYFDNGQVQQNSDYVAGKLEGYIQTYDKEGRQLEEIIYQNGLKDGFYKIFNLNGTLKFKDLYREDKKMSRKIFDEDGRLITEEKYF